MDLTLDIEWGYRGYHGANSRCRIQTYEERGFPPVIVATEVPDNPGTSVTNVAEYLAAHVVGTLLPLCFEDPAGFCWVERYPADRWRPGRREGLAIVTFRYRAPRLKPLSPTTYVASLGDPKWQPLTREGFETLIGQPYPEPAVVDAWGNPAAATAAV